MAFASCVDVFSVEITINLEDINVDDLERQPEMVFGNLVKRRAEVKASTLNSTKEERAGTSQRQRAEHLDGTCSRGSSSEKRHPAGGTHENEVGRDHKSRR